MFDEVSGQIFNYSFFICFLISGFFFIWNFYIVNGSASVLSLDILKQERGGMVRNIGPGNLQTLQSSGLPGTVFDTPT